METIGLFVYLLQQLGMTLGVGSSTFALTFYILASRDGKVDASERRFMHAVYTVLRIGLFLIIVSGLAITAAHVLAGETALLSEPAFLFKWVIIGIIVLNAVLMSLHAIPMPIGAPLAGGSWYSLFFLHNTAPETDWLTLVSLYLGFLIIMGFGLELIKRMSRGNFERMMPAISPLSVRYGRPPVAMSSPAPRISEEGSVLKSAIPQNYATWPRTMPKAVAPSPTGFSPRPAPVSPQSIAWNIPKVEPKPQTPPPQRPIVSETPSVDFKLAPAPQKTTPPPQELEHPHTLPPPPQPPGTPEKQS